MGEDPRVVRSRAAVVEATLALVAEVGIGETTVDAIAERSGVAKTTIYRHWTGKPAIVLDALSSVMAPPADPDTGTVRDDLVVLLEGFATACPTVTGAPADLDDGGRRTRSRRRPPAPRRGGRPPRMRCCATRWSGAWGGANCRGGPTPTRWWPPWSDRSSTAGWWPVIRSGRARSPTWSTAPCGRGERPERISVERYVFVA